MLGQEDGNLPRVDVFEIDESACFLCSQCGWLFGLIMLEGLLVPSSRSLELL